MYPEKYRATKRKLYRERRKAGLCTKCGKPSLRATCDRCYVKLQLQKEEYRDLGFCVRCARPLDSEIDAGYVTCQCCREAKTWRFSQRTYRRTIPLYYQAIGTEEAVCTMTGPQETL